MKKITAILLALILCLSFFAGCSKKEDADTNSLDSSIVARIGDYELSQAYFNLVYYNVLYSQFTQYGNLDVIDMVEEDFNINIAAVLMAKEKYGITDKDVKEAVAKQKEEILASYGSEEEFKSFLTEARTTEKAVDDYLEVYAIYDLLAEKMAGEGEECYVSETEIEEGMQMYYGDKLKVQHILIATQSPDGSAPEKTEEEALKIANEALAELEAGEDFDALIEKYDEDPGMTPGNYYTFGSGEMVEEFELASKNLEVGEYTKEPVKTSYGYHIIKRYAIDSESEEYKQYKIYLASQKLYPILTEKVKDMEIEWNDDSLKAYVKQWHIDLGIEPDPNEKAEEEAEAEVDVETETEADAESNAEAETKTEEKETK